MLKENWRKLLNWQKSILLAIVLPPFAVAVLFILATLIFQLGKLNLPKFIEIFIQIVAELFGIGGMPTKFYTKILPTYFSLIFFLLVLVPSHIFAMRAYQNKERFAWVTLIGSFVLLVGIVWFISIAVQLAP